MLIVTNVLPRMKVLQGVVGVVINVLQACLMSDMHATLAVSIMRAS